MATFFDPPAAPMVPRARSPWEGRLVGAAQPIYSEDQLRNAMTQALAGDKLCRLIQAGDFTVAAPITIPPALSKGFFLEGTGDFTLYCATTVPSLFVCQSTTQISNVNIRVANATAIFNVSSDVQFSVDNTDVEVDGYVSRVFDLSGIHSQSIMSNMTITGNVGAVFGGSSTSFNWLATGIRCFNFGNIFDSSRIYRNVSIQDLYVDPTTVPALGTISAGFDQSEFRNIQNVKTIANIGGSRTLWDNIYTPSNGTFTTSSSDIIMSTHNYTVTMGSSAAYVNYAAPSGATAPVVFAAGMGLGNPRLNQNLPYEEFLSGSTSTTDGTIKVGLTYTTASNNTYQFEIDVVGHQTNGTNQVNSYKRIVKCKNNAGTLTLGSITSIYTDEEVAPWDVTVDNSDPDIRVKVTGAAATNITWAIYLKVRRI